jgi:hypothetical protein
LGGLGGRKFLFGQVGRQRYEVRDFKKFGRLGRSESLRGWRFGMTGMAEGQKEPIDGKKCIFANSLQLCVIFEVILHRETSPSITVVLHVVQNQINVSI